MRFRLEHFTCLNSISSHGPWYWSLFSRLLRFPGILGKCIFAGPLWPFLEPSLFSRARGEGEREERQKETKNARTEEPKIERTRQKKRQERQTRQTAGTTEINTQRRLWYETPIFMTNTISLQLALLLFLRVSCFMMICHYSRFPITYYHRSSYIIMVNHI